MGSTLVLLAPLYPRHYKAPPIPAVGRYSQRQSSTMAMPAVHVLEGSTVTGSHLGSSGRAFWSRGEEVGPAATLAAGS